MIENILISVISSSVVLGIFVFILRKSIASLFEKRMKYLDRDINSVGKVSDCVIDTRLGVYPEVSEVVHRLRNMSRDIVHSGVSGDEPREFSRALFHLVENVYKYEVFFNIKLYRKIHRYKTLSQEFFVLLNEVTRPDNVEDSPIDMDIKNLSKDQMKEKAEELDKLYQEIIAEIRSQIILENNELIP